MDGALAARAIWLAIDPAFPRFGLGCLISPAFARLRARYFDIGFRSVMGRPYSKFKTEKAMQVYPHRSVRVQLTTTI